MPAKPTTIMVTPIGSPATSSSTMHATPARPICALPRLAMDSSAASAASTPSAARSAGHCARARHSSAARAALRANCARNSSAVTAAPSTITARNGQIRNTNTPGVPVISSLDHASASLGQVPQVITANTAAPTSW